MTITCINITKHISTVISLIFVDSLWICYDYEMLMCKICVRLSVNDRTDWHTVYDNCQGCIQLLLTLSSQSMAEHIVYDDSLVLHTISADSTVSPWLDRLSTIVRQSPKEKVLSLSKNTPWHKVNVQWRVRGWITTRPFSSTSTLFTRVVVRTAHMWSSRPACSTYQFIYLSVSKLSRFLTVFLSPTFWSLQKAVQSNFIEHFTTVTEKFEGGRGRERKRRKRNYRKWDAREHECKNKKKRGGGGRETDGERRTAEAELK